jgi:hypothetical protein
MPARLGSADSTRGYFKRVFDGSKSCDMAFNNEQGQKYDNIMVRSADVVIRQELLDGRQVANPGRVTFVYRNSPQRWHIVHYHGSARPSLRPARPLAPRLRLAEGRAFLPCCENLAPGFHPSHSYEESAMKITIPAPLQQEH